ncbi:MAG: S41 family peptidase, partial [Dehalococcoidia bacterium]|nr:S41 family peptidase [Dehalococcoidia bacterium]
MGNTFKTHILLIILLVLVIVLLVMNHGSPWFSPSPTESEFDLVEEAWQVIVNDYVNSDDMDLTKLSQGAIKGMVEALDDPYSAYFDVEQYKLSEYRIEGSFGGIGVEITFTSEGQLTVIAPIVGTPAHAAGIMPGDRIIAIDGELTEGMDMVEAVMKVRGEIGEQVTLSILHEGAEVPEDYTITREKIELSSVISKMLADNIAHIEISHFSSRTGAEMVSALEDIAVNDVNGIILDLRNNPGGVLKSAVTVASQFLDGGVVTYVIYGDGHEETWSVEDVGLLPD